MINVYEPVGLYFGREFKALLQNLTETDLRRYETPPARRDAAESLANVIIIEPGMQCFVCLDDFEVGTLGKQMPFVLCFALLPNFDAIIAALEKRLEQDIVKRALSYPLKLIAKNAGVNGSVISEKLSFVLRAGPSNENVKFSYNAATGKEPECAALSGYYVVRCCLEHAASVAKMFLMSDCVVVVEIKEPEPVPAQATPRLWTTQARSDIH
ncbi:hypothetical protein Bca4012_058084 [Brassica carinata]